MKKFYKVVCCVLSLLMLSAMCFSLVACEDIKKAEVTVSVYDSSEKAVVEKTVSVNLYRHLANDTVDAIRKYAENGYYDDLIFYKDNTYSSQIFIGGVKYVGGEVVNYTADYVENIAGEFKAAGVVGSDLVNESGAIGLWRTWYANSNYNQNGDAGFNSGAATLYMPTSTKSEYNGYFCILGKIDLDDDDTSDAFSLIKSVLDSSDYTTAYIQYYTGEYGNLTYHCVPKDDFDESIEVFEAKGDQFVSFNKRELKIPVADINGVQNVVTAKITKVTVK